MKKLAHPIVAIMVGLMLVAASCGSSETTSSNGAAGQADADRPTVAVTTNILGDVVANLVGDEMNVLTIMPVGADPHDFQASAQQVASLGEADALVANGGDFEEGLLDVIKSSEGDGMAVFEALNAVQAIDFGEKGHDDHDDEEHGDEEHDDHGDEEHGDEDHDEHGHDGVDPHFFTDPARMAVAADAIADFLVANVEGVDATALTENAAAYVAELEALDAEVEQTLAAIDSEVRVLVTNHEVFGYFADRYDFEVVGTVIPAGSTADGTSAQALTELAEVIEHEGVGAVFADTSSSDELAETLAAEVGDIGVVELFSESLGEDGSDGSTYIAMVRTNAERIVGALAP